MEQEESLVMVGYNLLEFLQSDARREMKESECLNNVRIRNVLSSAYVAPRECRASIVSALEEAELINVLKGFEQKPHLTVVLPSLG